MAIKIKGVIGWDVIGTYFADTISRLSGDIDIEIDSPGGYVTDGISIFNALKRYDKGKVNIHVVGECSSMAAYIMLSGDTLVFEPNSIVVLHNPWAGACGDYRAMLHEAEILEKMTMLYAGEFVKKGIFDEPTIRAYMDSEKWFIGAEDLKLLGNVVERDIPKIEDIEKQAMAATALNNIKAWQTKAQKALKDDLSRAAALISSAENTFNAPASMGCNSSAFLAEISEAQTFEPVLIQAEPQSLNNTSQNGKDNKIMDLKELKTSHPDVYSAALKEGKEQAQKEIKALLEFLDDDKETVIQAINDGKTVRDDEVFAKLTRARINTETIKAMEGNNPPAVTPAAAVLAPESEQAIKEAQAQAEAAKNKAIVDEIVGYCNV